MKIFIARHGQDDNTVRGGWSESGLTEAGFAQSQKLAEEICKNKDSFNIGRIFSSDIIRAAQTAYTVAEKLGIDVEFIPNFREVNNGKLAGMDNAVAERIYPNMYWRSLGWEERYPGGESPKEFYERVCAEWVRFTKSLENFDENVLLITHGGVINIIRCIVNNEAYSNKTVYPKIPNAEIILETEV